MQSTVNFKVTETAATEIKRIADEQGIENPILRVIDYVQDFMGGGFTIKNPNAASSCGCGNSFSC